SVFEEAGIHSNGIFIPHICSLQHYHELVQLFDSPNGLCSLIVESKHIWAVKKPWRRSNKHQALGQMLLTNQCLDKLSQYRVD
ncbi:hypothetical protein PAXINDRAFT_34587, partial [Paxillus involutus ATCC 200175]